MRRGFALAVVASWLVAAAALAHPVRIGRYAEIPHGVDPAHPYPALGGGPHRMGRIQGVVPPTAPEMIWERGLPHRHPRGPTIAADGTLYFGTREGLVARRPDGHERWVLDDLGPVNVAPSLTPSNELVAVTVGGRLALVTTDGVLRRSVELGAATHAAPLVLDDGSVVVGTADGRIHRLNSNLRPVFDVAQPGVGGLGQTASLARRGSLVLPGSNTIAILDPRGALLRRVDLEARSTSAVVVGEDGILWVSTANGILLAIEPGGRVRSRTELGGVHDDGAWLALGHDGAVRVPTRGGLVCVGPGGTSRWTFAGTFRTPVVIGEADTVLAIDQARVLHAVAADGTERWHVSLGGAISNNPPVMAADGTIYVLANRRLQAWRTRPVSDRPAAD